MNRAHDNADRNFCADTRDEGRPADLRALLKTTKVADYLDGKVRERVGALIARAVSDYWKW
jgi:hypothetical protein